MRHDVYLLGTDRNSLLLAILQSGRATVDQLELSTGEAMHLIPPEKNAILHEIYYYARIDELRVRHGEGLCFFELFLYAHVIKVC